MRIAPIPRLTTLSATQEALFPDCNRTVRCCDGFVVCDNNHGKSIARTTYLKRLTHHRHKLTPGGVERSFQVRTDGCTGHRFRVPRVLLL